MPWNYSTAFFKLKFSIFLFVSLIALWWNSIPFLPSEKTHSLLQKALHASSFEERREAALQTIAVGQGCLSKSPSFESAKDIAKAYELLKRQAYAKAFYVYAASLQPYDLSVRKEINKLNNALHLAPTYYRFYPLRVLLGAGLILTAAFLLYQGIQTLQARLVFCAHSTAVVLVVALCAYELWGREVKCVLLEPVAISSKTPHQCLPPGFEVTVQGIDLSQHRYLFLHEKSVYSAPLASFLVVN